MLRGKLIALITRIRKDDLKKWKIERGKGVIETESRTKKIVKFRAEINETGRRKIEKKSTPGDTSLKTSMKLINYTPS